ncbi:MAG TPA: DUF2461 domain-containing protein [Hanamia sp.]|jgi:uncharacterized protein (TIGR02453 family)|nr:DUF2461 domain-containing protein [Hanamia sp.]
MTIQPSTLSFLKSLKKNNNKQWFDENREKYESARANFQEFITGLLHNMVAFDSDMKELEAKKCMFRINRDIRFSKNKTPYKINISAHFNKGGKKSVHAGYYFHLQPGGNSFVGGGLWMPEAVELKKLRQEIDYCFPEFKKIITNSAFKKQYGELEKEDMLVNVPKGYDKENPAADFLKLKSFVATKRISDEEVLSPKLSNEIITAFKVLMPLLKFMNKAFD